VLVLHLAEAATDTSKPPENFDRCLVVFMYQDGSDEIQASSVSKGETSIVTELGARMISLCTYSELCSSSY